MKQHNKKECGKKQSRWSWLRLNLIDICKKGFLRHQYIVHEQSRGFTYIRRMPIRKMETPLFFISHRSFEGVEKRKKRNPVVPMQLGGEKKSHLLWCKNRKAEAARIYYADAFIEEAGQLFRKSFLEVPWLTTEILDDYQWTDSQLQLVELLTWVWLVAYRGV